MLPHSPGRAPWFAFLCHPRDTRDLYRYPAMRTLRQLSGSEAEFEARATALPPLVVAQIRFPPAAAWGELIVVPRLPEQLMTPEGRAAVADAAKVAASRGASVIGLGGLTSPATGAGATLLAHLPPAVTLTTGNAYTAAVVHANVREAAEHLGLGTRARVAVVGCTGSVGVAACRLLAAAGFPLVLIGRTEGRARALLEDHAPNAVYCGDAARAAECDVVVLLTSDASARLAPEHTRPGSVVVDCAQPANVTAEHVAAFRARGVAVREGAVVRIPAYDCPFDLGLESPGDTFACLAETYLFARGGVRAHSVGRAEAELAVRMEALATRYGVLPRPLALDHEPEAEPEPESAPRRPRAPVLQPA